MPNMDKTGPRGQGSRTGRQMGTCGGNSQGNTLRRGLGRGRQMGRGLGNCFRRPSEPIEINLSKEEQIKILESEKAEIEKRLNELNNE